MGHPHAPHTMTMTVELRLFEQRDSGEFVGADNGKTLIFSLPCRNQSEGQEAKQITEEVIRKCLEQVKLQMNPQKS